MKKTNIILSSILAILVLAFVLGKVLINNELNSNKTIKSSLLNRKYHNEICQIFINSDISLTKKDDNWFVKYDKNLTDNMTEKTDFLQNSEQKYDNFSYYNTLIKADDAVVYSLLTNLEKIQNMSQIKKLNQKKYDIYFDKFIKIKTENENTVCDLNFSNSDFTETLVYLQNNKNMKIYSVQDSYSEFLNGDIKFFMNKAFFPKSFTQKKDEIQSINIRSGNKIKTLTKGSKEFNSKLDDIISLESAKIVDASVIEGLERILEISAEKGDLTSASITLYKGQNAYYVFAQNILYEISQYTAEQILK